MSCAYICGVCMHVFFVKSVALDLGTIIQLTLSLPPSVPFKHDKQFVQLEKRQSENTYLNSNKKQSNK